MTAMVTTAITTMAATTTTVLGAMTTTTAMPMASGELSQNDSETIQQETEMSLERARMSTYWSETVPTVPRIVPKVLLELFQTVMHRA